jgi:predicted DNA binding CopG/RHH family protein
MRNPSDTIAGSETGPDAACGKPLPRFASDKEAEAFVEAADLSDYDLLAFAKTRFETLVQKDTATEHKDS